MPATRHWEHFPHEADIGVRGIGSTKVEAFAEAAAAMMAASIDIGRIRPSERVEIACAAPDDELLLVDWLNALIYEMAARRMVFARFEVEIAGGKLAASAWGEPVDVARHEPAVEVKGATYTALKVAPSDGGWIAQCVVDV
jgi:tRNA nucleotidyltransferase (CCA-adding enzyme)